MSDTIYHEGKPVWVYHETLARLMPTGPQHPVTRHRMAAILSRYSERGDNLMVLAYASVLLERGLDEKTTT